MPPLTRSAFLGIVSAAPWALSQNAFAAEADSDDERPASGIHPRVYMTPTDVRRARENVKRHAWARAEKEAILAEADKWLAKSPTWIREVMPAAGACFAYGLTGCPICGSPWGQWWSANASFENPGHVTCTGGHTLPDAAHPDPGTGYVAPDGRIHYFIGSYNAWVIEKLIFGAANHLAYAYSLTGDGRYAEHCAVVLDAIARIYPGCDKGSWDYPSTPPSGRLDRPWYQVARVLVHLTDQYDQIFHADAALDVPSLVPGLSRRKNIEENMLKNGAAYCYQQSSHYHVLNNGNADYMRGAMAVGLCLDIPEYIRHAIDSPCGARSLLDNNLDRDGKYYETSTLYASHSRELYVSFAEPLANFRGNADYPQGIDLYAHPRLRRFLVLHNLSQKCCGHTPRFGDSSPDTLYIAPTERVTDEPDIRSLERVYARTRDRGERQRIGELLKAISPDGNVDKLRMEAKSLNTLVGGGFTADRCWLLFHAGDAPKARSSDALTRLLSESVLLGQKGIGILRRGSGNNAQGLVLRFGPTLNHGHLDDLNLNFFSHGYEVTYDLGYGLASTHTQVGWARLTAAHNLVVVDQKSQMGPGSGGSLHLFASLPGDGLRAIEASSESSYGEVGVSVYRRTVVLIDGLMVDLFRVRGGGKHDYFFHGLGPTAELSGLSLGPEEPGSLAGAEYEWGNMQLNDGDLKGYPNKPYWIAPPGNGYGFLTHVRRTAVPEAGASKLHAEWTMDEKTRLRLHVAPEAAGDKVITAQAPGIVQAQPKAGYLVVSRQGKDLESSFASVAEPYATASGPTVASVERLKTAAAATGNGIAPVALNITRTNGCRHLVYSAGSATPVSAGNAQVGGRLLHALYDAANHLDLLEAVAVASYEENGWNITAPRDAWRGAIATIEDGERGILTVRIDGSDSLPTHLAGRIVTFSHPRYTRGTSYTIARVESAGKGLARLHLNAPLDLGRAVVDAIPDSTTLTTRVPHEYSRPPKRTTDSGFLVGKRLRTPGGTETFLRSTQHGNIESLIVEKSEGFHPGDSFQYWDLTPGDTFEILSQWSLHRTGPDAYRLEGDTEGVVVRASSEKRTRIERSKPS